MDDISVWWYDWGVLLFLFVNIGLVAAITYHSQARRLRILGWQIVLGLLTLLLFPSLILKFAPPETQVRWAGQLMPFFYLGLVGSAGCLAVAVVYFISMARQKICPQCGRAYDPILPGCPYCVSPSPPPVLYRPVEERVQPPHSSRAELAPARERVNAWLVEGLSERNYQLFQGDTRIGRDSANDIVIHDRAVSREHILIREEQGHFMLYDRGARTGTLVNGQQITGPLALQHGDKIIIGDTELEFVTAL